jgi:hypothetical protein
MPPDTLGQGDPVPVSGPGRDRDEDAPGRGTGAPDPSGPLVWRAGTISEDTFTEYAGSGVFALLVTPFDQSAAAAPAVVSPLAPRVTCTNGPQAAALWDQPVLGLRQGRRFMAAHPDHRSAGCWRWNGS